MQWKICKLLATKYENVILGEIRIQNICQKEDVDEMTKRVGSILGHYKFREKLVYKCLTYGTKVYIVPEKYTTKMCNICGTWNEYVKYEKIIECVGCKKRYMRDGYAARGMIIINMEDIE